MPLRRLGSQQRVIPVPPVRATTRKCPAGAAARPGCSARSTRWSRGSRRPRIGHWMPRRAVEHGGERDDEIEGVEPVEHAAVPGNEVARVLDAGFALEERFGQIAHLADDGPARPAHSSSARAGSRGRAAGTPGRRRAGPRRRPPTTPARLPERVFPGLTTGASLGPPMARPPNMAAVSQIQVTTRGKNTSAAPGPATER